MAKYAMCTVCGYTIAIPNDAVAGDYMCPIDMIPLVATTVGRDFSKSYLLYAMEKGDAYAASIRVEDVADDGTLNVLLSNPADSPKDICWVSLTAASEGKSYLDMYGQVTVNAPGTALFQTQKFSGSSNTSVADTEYNGTYTAVHRIFNCLIPGGSGPRTVGGKASDAELAMAIPGRNVLMVLTNKGGAAKDMAMRIVWIDVEP